MISYGPDAPTGDRPRDAAGGRSTRSCAARLRRRDGEVGVPTWRARDVTREIDVVEEVARFRLEEVPLTLPRAGRDVRPADPRAAAAPPRRGHLVGSASPRCTRRRSPPTMPTRTRFVLPEPITRARASCAPRCSRPRRGRAQNATSATSGSRCSRSRACTSRAARLPHEPWHVGGVSEADSPARRARSRRLLGAEGRAAFERADALVPSRQAGPHRGGGRRGAASERCSRATWGAFELDLRHGFRRVARPPSKYEDVIRYPAVHQDLAFSVYVGGLGRRALRRRAGGRGPGAARDPLASTSTAGTGPRRAGSRSRFAVSFQSPAADALRRRTRHRCAWGRRALAAPFRRGAPGLAQTDPGPAA